MTKQIPSNNEEFMADPYRHIAEAVYQILTSIGEDPDREGLVQTPKRVAQMYAELTAGYHVDLKTLVNGAIFHVDYTEMVVVLDIDFSSLCEHHLLPFFGKVHVAYIPDRRVIGLSKLPRIVEMYARRLQIQERMTSEIANAIQQILGPKGVGVIIDAKHMCTMVRGVEKINARMITKAMLGNFGDANIRNEFFSHIGYKDEEGTQHNHDYQREEGYL
jgi:GTP cyclohydrolase IA